MMPDTGLPLWYYRAYRKALRDFRAALEKCGPNLKMYGMNNWKGVCAMLTCVLKDIEPLMQTVSMTCYEIPEPYMTKWRKYCQKKKAQIAVKEGNT